MWHDSQFGCHRHILPLLHTTGEDSWLASVVLADYRIKEEILLLPLVLCVRVLTRQRSSILLLSL